MRRDQFLYHQRHPRRLFPDSILRVFIQPRFFLRIGGFQRVVEVFIHLGIAIESRIEQGRRPVLRREQRRQRPVRFSGRRRPAGIEHAYAALFLPLTFHFRRALARIHRRQLRLNAHLRQLLLGKLQHFLRGTVVVRRPQRGAKSIRIARLFQQLASLRRIVRPGAVAFSVGN